MDTNEVLPFAVSAAFAVMVSIIGYLVIERIHHGSALVILVKVSSHIQKQQHGSFTESKCCCFLLSFVSVCRELIAHLIVSLGFSVFLIFSLFIMKLVQKLICAFHG